MEFTLDHMGSQITKHFFVMLALFDLISERTPQG